MGTPQRHNQDKNDSRLERSKFVYEQAKSWIENADNKVSVCCGLLTAVFGVISFLSGRITTSEVVNECWQRAHHLSFAFSLGIMLVSILFYVLAINPNLGKSGKKKNGSIPSKKHPVFYGDIAKMSLEDYKKAMNKATDEDFIDELQNEAHYNSIICASKMYYYKVGLWLSFAAVVIAGFSWLSRFLMMK